MPKCRNQTCDWCIIRLHVWHIHYAFSIVPFAKNLSGYRLLMRLSSEKMINGHLDLSEYLTLPDLFGILPQGQGFSPDQSEDLAQLSRALTDFVARFDQKSLFLGVQKQRQRQKRVVSTARS